MPTVTISATDYAVYADLPAANAFLAADFGATDWRAETDTDEQKRALVTATRLLNRLNWAADRDWPRPGTDDTQTAAVPQPVIDASIALAKLIHSGSKVDSQPSTQTGNIRSQRAGSVAIEYFFPLDDPTRLPVEISELIGPYLAGATIGGALASGTCGKSITCRDFETGWPE
jgi:hypothetical protein